MDAKGFLREVSLRRDRIPDFKVFPFCIPAVRTFERLAFNPEVTIFIGENGSGKSTFIEAIAILAGLNPEGGTRNFNFALRPTESNLHAGLRLTRNYRREKSAFFLRAETLFNIATEAENRGLELYGWTKIHEKSHGEAFLWIIENRFHPNGLYILDEPESALSPRKQLVLLRRMHDLVAGGSQFIFATHSPLLMAYPGADIYQFSDSGIARVGYKDTEHYSVTRAFLEFPELSLQELFAPAPRRARKKRGQGTAPAP